MEPISAFVASILSPAVADRLMPEGPVGEPVIDLVLIGHDSRPRSDRFSDQRFGRPLFDIRQHSDHDLAATLDHAEHRRLLFLQRPSSALAFQSATRSGFSTGS